MVHKRFGGIRFNTVHRDFSASIPVAVSQFLNSFTFYEGFAPKNISFSSITFYGVEPLIILSSFHDTRMVD
jgi:hypothetical protein